MAHGRIWVRLIFAEISANLELDLSQELSPDYTRIFLWRFQNCWWNFWSYKYRRLIRVTKSYRLVGMCFDQSKTPQPHSFLFFSADLRCQLISSFVVGGLLLLHPTPAQAFTPLRDLCFSVVGMASVNPASEPIQGEIVYNRDIIFLRLYFLVPLFHWIFFPLFD